MNRYVSCGVAALFASALGIVVGAQNPDEVARHKAAAEKAAGQEFAAVKRSACAERAQTAAPAAPAAPAAAVRGAAGRAGQAAAAPAARTTPPRDQWITEPAKIFDNFYFIGTREHGAWALTTSEGIIVFDALYDYAVIDAVEGGMKKLGLDPTQMKYLIITHGHGDHHGGTRYLQDKYKPRIVMGARDWELVTKDTRSPRPVKDPSKDIDATDGQKITLGDTTVTLYVTPGHTPTTLSPVITVKDNGVPHVAVEWGGTALNPTTSADAIRSYAESAARFRKIAADARADVIFTNHTAFDGTLQKIAALATRKPGTPHPFVVGPSVVDRYMAVVEECGRALAAAR
jgi:metallo-beta-lactamase class B